MTKLKHDVKTIQTGFPSKRHEQTNCVQTKQMNEIQNKTLRNKQMYQIIQSFLHYQTNSTMKRTSPHLSRPMAQKGCNKNRTHTKVQKIYKIY